MSKFASLLEFQKRFLSDEQCMQYLEKLRWPQGFRCPNCQHDVGYRLAYRGLIQCAVCRHQTSVTSGTLFHKTRIPLCIWFWMIYMIAQDKCGVSALKLSKDLGMHYSTVWHIMHKVRDAMRSRDQSIKLAGFIELDEAIIGPQARKPGRPSDNGTKKHPRKKSLGLRRRDGAQPKTQTEVVVMVEREHARAGNVVMKVVQSNTRDDIREAVSLRTEENQWFKTDGLQSHWVIKTMGHRLDCWPMDGKQSCEELPVVHRVIALVKRWLLGRFHGVSDRYLQSYLYEFCFRFNRRDREQSLSESLLRACALALPVAYAELKR